MIMHTRVCMYMITATDFATITENAIPGQWHMFEVFLLTPQGH